MIKARSNLRELPRKLKVPVYLILSYSCGSIDRLGLSIESLALRCLSAHSAEAFDAQLLPSLESCSGPGGDVLVGLLAGSVLLLGHNPVSLVHHQIGFLLVLVDIAPHGQQCREKNTSSSQVCVE